MAPKASPAPKTLITSRGDRSKIFTPFDYSAFPEIEAERQKNLRRFHGSNRLQLRRAAAQEAGGRVQIFNEHDGGLIVGKGKGKVAKKRSVATGKKSKGKGKAKVTKKGGGGTPAKRKTKPTPERTDVSLSERDLAQQRAQAWNDVFRLGGPH